MKNFPSIRMNSDPFSYILQSQIWSQPIVFSKHCVTKPGLGRGFFALGCTLYLKCNFDIFKNIKKFETKMFCVRVHVLRTYKFVSTKNNFLYGLCKIDKIWY
jgi:hypothetical protein